MIRLAVDFLVRRVKIGMLKYVVIHIFKKILLKIILYFSSSTMFISSVGQITGGKDTCQGNTTK